MIAWLTSPPSTAKRGDRWEGYVWHSHRRPALDSTFYRTPEWLRLRAETLAENMRWYGRKNPTCERCGHWRPHRIEFQPLPIIGLPWPTWQPRKFHGDHIVPRSIDPNLELEPDNIQCLCDRCNIAKGNRTTINWRAYRRWPLKAGYPVVWCRRWHQRAFKQWSC